MEPIKQNKSSFSSVEINKLLLSYSSLQCLIGQIPFQTPTLADDKNKMPAHT